MSIKKYFAEFSGTAVLVFMGCGAAVWGESVLAIAIAFGLAFIIMTYVIGDISGCHINPAVSIAMLINKKIGILDFGGYIVAQLLGAFAGSGLIKFLLVASRFEEKNLGANGVGFRGVVPALTIEIILTFIFVFTVLSVTSKEKNSRIAGALIGCTLTLVHIVGSNFTGTSVNPARSIAPAVLGGGVEFSELWIFIIAPFIGAIIAALAFKLLKSRKSIES